MIDITILNVSLVENTYITQVQSSIYIFDFSYWEKYNKGIHTLV